MTPEPAVARLVEILASKSEFGEDEVYEALELAGVPLSVADRTYKFTQIAWGRIFLDGMGIKFNPEYFCLDADGKVIESGKLADQPYYVAAMKAAKRRPVPAGLPRLALMSAEVHCVNELMLAGSKPENIATSRSALFMRCPTEAALEQVQQQLRESFVPRQKKPWWRFW